jgi:trehalose/maltose hydrolase-like predicted phosphorylase
MLPGAWKTMDFSFTFRGDEYHFILDTKALSISFSSGKKETGRVFIRGKRYELRHGETTKVSL